MPTAPDEPVIIVGNSMGAWLGFLYARDNPDRVARLVAVNGGPLFEPDPQVNIFPKTREEARETMKGLMGPASPQIPGYVLDDIVRRTANGPAARFGQTAAEMGVYLLDGRLDEVTVPVELVWGAADQLLDPRLCPADGRWSAAGAAASRSRVAATCPSASARSVPRGSDEGPRRKPRPSRDGSIEEGEPEVEP